jgi:hypothetical protein
VAFSVRSITCAGLVAIFAGFLIVVRISTACAPAPRMGEDVKIVDESAIIVWDEANHTEHFIRRATFKTETADFGFLVPTPSKPSLAEASDKAFTHIQRLLEPKTVVDLDRSPDFTPLIVRFLSALTRGEGAGAPVGAPPPVRVLDVQSVAGYDAVVLEADDAAALDAWLAKHGYASGPELKAWFKPYIAAHWKITAFKISKTPGSPQVGTSPVRMSFTTDRPLFPYREPAGAPPSSSAGDPTYRSLQILFLGDARVEGKIGNSGDPEWPGAARWSDQLTEAEVSGLATELALEDSRLPAKRWLTVFEDRSSPRPGVDDLYFARSESQSPIRPVTVLTRDARIPIPIDLVLFLVVAPIGIVLLSRRFRRRRAVH